MSKYNLIDIYEQYQIGSGWTTDFDYDGMLMAGLKAGVDTDIEILKKMSDDFEDVNYHRENNHLQNAIEALEDGATKEAAMFFGDFHAEIKQTIKDQGMDIEPTVGKFMASKMEEGEEVTETEEVEEVSSREGSRIEGLLSIPLKAKFLEAFQDLYFDLVEEDPFMAEDVVDHLSIEMLKHLDAIQAQGDKLAGVNTDADFEREQRAQLDMREEDSIEEGISTSDITKALKDDAKATDSEIKQYMASVKKAGDKFDDVDDYVEDFKNYVADKSLQEHFGRFMKDYQ
jgi:gas vesicle protein